MKSDYTDYENQYLYCWDDKPPLTTLLYFVHMGYSEVVVYFDLYKNYLVKKGCIYCITVY